MKLATNITSMHDTLSMIDKAAEQNDRWLFVAALCLLVGFVIMVWRWIINDRDKMSARLTAVTDRHISAMEKFSEVVATNTAVVAQNSEILHNVSQVIDRCKKLQ